jgi:hypothetical protein
MFRMQHAATGQTVYAASRRDVAYWTAAGYRVVETAWL